MRFRNPKRILLVVLVILSPTLLAEQTTINFSEYDQPAGDVVIDFQYAPQGVLFRASALVGTSDEIPNCRTVPNYLYDVYGISDSALRCRHIFYGFPDVGIRTRFINYNNVYDRNIYARKISFDLIIAVGSGASISMYDKNRQYIDGMSIKGGGVHHVELGKLVHEFRISVFDADSTFAIDNLSYELFRLKIVKPTPNQVFRLSNNNYREIDIEYETNILDRKVSFTNFGVWSTSQGSRALTTILENFSGSSSGPVSKTYTAKGGKFTLNASLVDSGVSTSANPITFYIVGAVIPDQVITNRLNSLYSRGTTPNLLTGIAMVESNYQQFRSFSLLGIVERWPNESAADGGSHIGLMQVPTTYGRAWDWMENTNDGARLFREKLRIAARLERRIRHEHRGLRRLTALEIEHMAVVLYGPFANASLEMQYYIPQDTVNGPVWAVNNSAAGNPNGVAYADSVYANVR